MMKRGKDLPDEDHVMRHVSWTRLRKDEHENVIGFLPHAFELKPGEESLSVNWLEYFNGDQENRIRDSLKLFRNTIDVSLKSAFGIGNIGKIKGVCSANGAQVRIVYAPEDKNKAHSAIRYLPQSDLSLLDALAADDLFELVRVADVKEEQSGTWSK